MWSLRKITYYRLGNEHVHIFTDHRALEAAMQRPLSPDLSSRVFRLLEEAMSCNITISWIPAGSNLLADALSRAPQGPADAPHYPRFGDAQGRVEVKTVVCRLQQGQIIDPLLVKVAEAAGEDEDYREVVEAVSSGMDISSLTSTHPARKYQSVFSKLTVMKLREGSILLLEGARVVIPKALVPQTIKTLHKMHTSCDTMIKVALRTCFWPGFSQDITAFSKACETCQIHKSLQFPPVKLQIQDVVDIRVMDRLQCDWGEKDGRNFHLIVDHSSLYLWCQEFKQKSTQNSLAHVLSVIQQFGRPLEIITDRGPSYRLGFEEALEEMGVQMRHGASYNPRSQAVAEKAVGRLKKAIAKNPVRGPADLQEVVSHLNWVASSATGAGSASDRMFGRTVRGMLPAAPGELSPEARKLMLDTLAKNRARIAKKFRNSSEAAFQCGQEVLVWNRRDRAYTDRGIVTDLEEGDDGYPRSFVVDLVGGTQVHLHSNHLLPAPQSEGDQGEVAGAV